MSNQDAHETLKLVQVFLDSYLKGHTAQKRRGRGVSYRYIGDELLEEIMELERSDRFPEIDYKIDGLIDPEDPGHSPPFKKNMSKEARRASRSLRQTVLDHHCAQMSISSHLGWAAMRDYDRDGSGQADIWPSPKQMHRMMYEWLITRQGQRGFAVWFVGLPGSGKTTMAASLYLRLFGETCETPLMLVDYDLQRNHDILLAPALGHFYTIGGVKGKPEFGSVSRLKRTKRLASQIGKWSNGGSVVGATFCPSPKFRRMLFDASRKRFVLVHVNTPLEVCKKRREREQIYTDPNKDPGIDDFVPPSMAEGDVAPDLVIDTASEPLWKSVARVLRVLKERGWMGMPAHLRFQ